ncbi:MAG: bifunctional metallophosphatase/5'-nucleotidase [Clostridia bacterium]|nr:bifunctional metallophosphatase/5'-nucleotidase [Clostridia bacterium]
MKKIVIFLMIFTMIYSLCACSQVPSEQNNVVVLFTNDVHCGIDSKDGEANIGYAGLSALKKDMSEKYKYVVLADCGDFSQGSYEGIVSKGEYIVELMNAVGYDYSIFGNHEFDYGIEQLKKNVQNSNAQFLCSNISYYGNGENWLEKETKPYDIKTYGNISVAFIGVTTPWTIKNTSPTSFMEDGEIVYDFGQNQGGEYFYEIVQKNVDECRAKNVDFVVVLSHLGVDECDEPFNSLNLIEKTTGIDVVLDAHSHVEASCWIRQNKDGDDVLLSSTGTKLTNVGKLVLSKDGTASVGYIDSYTKKDEDIVQKIASIRSRFEEKMNATIGHIDYNLPIKDEEGVRMIRTREMALGDLVADAYKTVCNADIGICNGGGIRAGINSGDISYKNVIEINPYGNMMCVVKVTGQEIVDMLEFLNRYIEAEYKVDGKPYGEEGHFQQVSGLKFTIDTSKESLFETNENNMLLKVIEGSRISDVMVRKDGKYVPIELKATYTLASHNYLIKNGGGGMLEFLKNHELVLDEAMPDYQTLIDYITLLGDDMSQYQNVDNRIIVK